MDSRSPLVASSSSPYRRYVMEAQNVFSYCVGALALLSTISSVLFYCGLYLPSHQLRVLDALLLETNDIYQKVNDEGLLPDRAHRYAQTRLRRYKDDTDILREETYRARSCFDTAASLFMGHTTRIMRVAKGVKRLRAFLMTTSQEEKARRLQEGRRVQVTSSARGEVSESAAQELTSCFDDLELAEVGQATYGSSLPSDLAISTLPSLPLDIECSRNDIDLSDTVSLPFSLPPDGNRHTACFVCSSWEWLTRKTSRTTTNLQSHEVWGEDPSSDESTASRTSTLVTRQARSSTLSSWISRAVPIPGSNWRFLRTPTNSVASSPLDDASQVSSV